MVPNLTYVGSDLAHSEQLFSTSELVKPNFKLVFIFILLFYLIICGKFCVVEDLIDVNSLACFQTSFCH